MNETDALRSLMQADRWIERVSAQRSHLPEIAELATLESNLRDLLHDLRSAEAELAPMRVRYEEVARESQRLKVRARDLDATLATSTANARELTALHGELAHVRTLLSESEDRELELLFEVEPLEEAVGAIKQRAQPGVVRRGELRDTIAHLQASLDDELVALRSDREERALNLPLALLARYDAAMARAGASGASQVVEGRCDGCRLALSPLDLDHFKAQPVDTFMECPECGRLLMS